MIPIVATFVLATKQVTNQTQMIKGKIKILSKNDVTHSLRILNLKSH